MRDKKYGNVTIERRPDAPADEPCFVLRGQDILAPIAMAAYADAVEATIPGTQGKYAAEQIREQCKTFAAWQNRKLPDGLT